MALIKQFGLAGLNENVQFGKSNGRLKFDNASGTFSVRNLADSDLVNIRVKDPVINSDAATKFYVDSVAQGLQPKDAVRVATNSLTTVDSNVGGGVQPNDMNNLTYLPVDDQWTLTGGVLDDITLVNNDRVLVKDADPGDQPGNGIFVYQTSNNRLVRAADADGINDSFGGGVFVFVLEGTVWANTGWVVSSPTGAATLGTDPIVWAQFSRVTGIHADDGLAQDGNRIYVRTDGVTIHLDNDDIAVKSSATQYQSLISDGAGGTAAWGAISLNEADATQNALRRDRGGFGVDVSAFADQSLYLSNGTITTELPIGNPGEVLTVDVNGNLIYDTIVNVIGILDEAQGGTGESTYNQYDLLIGDASNGLTKLPVGVAGQVLVINSSGALVWGAVDLTDADALSGTLPESHGGTGQSSYTKGDLIYASSTGADGALTTLPIGVQGQVLTVDGNSQPVWANGLTGVSNTKQLALTTTTGTLGISSAIPANSRVTGVTVSIDTAYDSGVSMIVGDPSNADALATADEIDPQTTGLYKIDLMHYYSASTQLSISISGTATTGSGYIIVDYVAT